MTDPTVTQHTLHTNYGPVVVALRDGKLPVQVYDQGCNPWERGEALVDPADANDGPAWGQGWMVTDVAGKNVWYWTNWDSSG